MQFEIQYRNPIDKSRHNQHAIRAFDQLKAQTLQIFPCGEKKHIVMFIAV